MKCPADWHPPISDVDPMQARAASAAEISLAKIISYLLEKFSGGTLTITSAEWEAYVASHEAGLLKTEMGEGNSLTLTSMIGDEAASTRLLLEMPNGGKSH